MKYQPDNELISAYLDGELTDAEQAQVEQMLAASPAARRLLDEMRALGTSLQSLPQRKLGEDLSKSVLQAAASRQSNGLDGSQPASQRPKQASSRTPLVRRIVERIKNNPRIIVWPLVVLTTAVLLTVFNPEQPGPGGKGGRQIAQAPVKQSGEDNRATDAKLVEPKQGDVVKTEDQPTISAVPPTNTTDKAPRLVMKGNGDETKIPPSSKSLAGLIVIQCQVSADVLKEESYRKIFDASSIALPKESASEVFHLSSAEIAEATGLDAKSLASDPKADVTPKAKLIAVEATLVQIAGILNGLKSQPDMYHEVSIKTPSTTPPPAAANPATKRVLVVFRTP
jgi:hypothetical protein